MYVIYKTEHGKDSKPTFIPGQYTTREEAQEDMAYYARQEFAKALSESQKLNEKFGPLVGVSLDVDSVEILDATLLKPKTVDIDDVAKEDEETTEPVVSGTAAQPGDKIDVEMEGDVSVVEDGDDMDLESESLASDSEDDGEEVKVVGVVKRDLNKQLICNHAMIYRNDAQTSIDVIRLTEKRERRFFFFTKVVHVPEALVSFVVAEVPAIEEAVEEFKDEAPQKVIDTFETNRSILLTSLIEYDV